MAKTNFSGPISSGNIQTSNTGIIGSGVRNVGFVELAATYQFAFADFEYNNDDSIVASAQTAADGSSTIIAHTNVLDATSGTVVNKGGFKGAGQISINSAGNDAAKSIIIVGTDIFGNVQSETIAAAGNNSSVKTVQSYLTVTSITFSAQSVGAVKAGVVFGCFISWQCRSNFNSTPLAQTATTVTPNLANNIVIPKFSRITEMTLSNDVAYNTAGLDVMVGANLGQVPLDNPGNTLAANSTEYNYFAGANTGGAGLSDLKAIGNSSTPSPLLVTATGLVSTTVYPYQKLNQLNVSNGDTSPIFRDKVVIFSAATDDTLSTGSSTFKVKWLQNINNSPDGSGYVI